jgi:hypothetical protein
VSKCSPGLPIDIIIGTGLDYIDQKKMSGEEIMISIDQPRLWHHDEARNRSMPPEALFDRFPAKRKFSYCMITAKPEAIENNVQKR